MMTCTAVLNPDFNSIEITFPSIPSAAIRNALKSLRYRWHAAKKLWYGYTDMQTVSDALTAAGVDVNPAPVASDDCADEITAADPAPIADNVPHEAKYNPVYIGSLTIHHPSGVLEFRSLRDFFPMSAKDFKVVLPLLNYLDENTLRDFRHTLHVLRAEEEMTDNRASYLKRADSNIAAIDKRYGYMLN